MFKRGVFLALFLLAIFSTLDSWALKLELNKEQFVPGDKLELFLEKSWEGRVDLWLAVKLPDGSLFYMTPQGFIPDPSPYLLGAPSGGRETVLNIFLWEGLPYGTYTFYAAAFKHGEFFEKAADPARVTFVFTSEREPKPLIFSTTSFPDGVIGQRYLFMLEPSKWFPSFSGRNFGRGTSSRT